MFTEVDHLRDTLEKLYDKYNHKELIKPDPLQFVYHYSNKSDMEIAALLSAVLAYGRVAQIEKSLNKLFRLLGDSPYDYVINFGKSERKLLKNFKHRFTTGDDISDLLASLKKALSKYGSIENCFKTGYSDSDENIICALSGFCRCLGADAGRGLRYLLTDPAKGSACKRMNLFLRWMVRDDKVDTALWQSIDKAKLIVPVDVHMGRLCRILGFYDRKNISLKAALDITKAFSKLEPADPVKYDFALSRIGIVENCTGRKSNACNGCELSEYCAR